MKVFLRYFPVLILSGVLIACSSGGGGSDDDSSEPTVFSDTNARSIAQEGIDSVVLLRTVADLGNKGKSDKKPLDRAIETAIYRIFANTHKSGGTAVRTDETFNCSDGGTIDFSFDETSTSESGTTTFNDCNIGGLVLEGEFTYSSTFNDTTGEYSDSAEGELSIIADGQTITIELDFSETGNDISGEFSTSVDLSIDGGDDLTFSIVTTQPIMGVGEDVTSGEVILSGGDNTRIKVTVTGTNTADVFLDDGSGSFVFQDTITF